MSFTKLDGGITDSTLWMQPHDVLRVWVAMLAKCDAYGIVRASVPAFAHLCMVPIERLEQILAILTGPDPYSRTPDDEGRRLKTIEGGWVIVNYVKYRDLLQTKPQSHAERQRKYRERIGERDARVTHAVTRDASVTSKVTGDAEAEAEAKEKKDSFGVSSSKGDNCPHDAIICLYHEILPMLPTVREWTPARQKLLRTRWKEKPERQNLDWWRGFLEYVAKSDFLTGRTGNGKWTCSLPWLLKAENFAKVIEGHYENREAA